MYLKAFRATTPNTEIGTKTNKVMETLIRTNKTKEIIAVIVPPTS